MLARLTPPVYNPSACAAEKTPHENIFSLTDARDIPTSVNWNEHDTRLRSKWTGSLDADGKIARPSEEELLSILR